VLILRQFPEIDYGFAMVQLYVFTRRLRICSKRIERKSIKQDFEIKTLFVMQKLNFLLCMYIVKKRLE
jgi:hypothetical protein